MRIFIGSSSKDLAMRTAELLAEWTVSAKHEPVVWSEDLVSGTSLFDWVIQHADGCDGGVFVFTPDQVTMLRKGARRTTRDSVSSSKAST